MKIRPVAAELLHADGQTDMTKLIVAFRNFANAPKDAYSNLQYTATLSLCKNGTCTACDLRLRLALAHKHNLTWKESSSR